MRMGSGLRYNAPALRFNVGPSRFLALVVVGWVALGLLGLCAWALGGAGKSYAVLMFALLLWLAVSGVALWHSMHLPQGVLLWDGRGWHWGPAAAALVPVMPPRVHWDGQTRVLLSVQRLAPTGRAAGSRQWLWVERTMQPQSWLELRRAVYSRPRRDPGSAARAASLV